MTFMTEKEAKTKACHRTFNLVDAEEGLFGQHSISVTPMMCIASRCMAWRPSRGFPGTEVWIGKDKPDGEGWAPASDGRWERPCLEDIGYCGLAGKP